MASRSIELEVYFNCVPQQNRYKLDKSLDFDHDGVQTDLGVIANSMDEWEGNVAEQLQMTRPEIQAIKTEFPGQLLLQTRAALQKWQEKFGPMATYRALITAFVRAGKGNCAEAVCRILDSQPESRCVPVAQTPIQRYATYLKGVYDSAVVSSDKFPNLTCSEFINLALVKSGQFNRLEADEFTKATLHGHVDEILQKKEPIKLEEVLKPVEGQKRMKCVYMHGAPGVGKSTCVGELCRRWDEIDALKEYSLVILLRLREKWVQEAQNVKDLCYHDNKEVQEAVATEIEAREGKSVLFILDGFDELPASLRKHSIFIKLIRGSYLSHCTVLVTSRPSATADLLRVAKPQIHKQIEVVGFTQAQIEQYATVFFASQPDVLADFLMYISTHPAIRSLMYIPLNCAITAETYSHNRTVNRPIPQTMTQLYIEMSLTFLQRHLGEDDPLAEELPERLEDLPPQLLEPFRSLAKLAFEGLERNEVIFHKLPNSFVHFGFMNSPTELYMGRKASISHSFLHLTLQEFLAAFHISQLPPSEQQSVFENHCRTAGWDVVWRFVAGLSGFNGIGWEVVKSKSGNQIDGSLLSFLIQCLYEAQEKAEIDSLLGESVVSFGGHDLTAFDCYAVGYCMSNSKCMWKINMHNNESLGGTIIEMLNHGLHCPNKSPPQIYTNIISLKLSQCGLNSTAFDHLADVIPLMINLEELDISVNPAGDGGLVKLLHALSHLKHFKTLEIYETKIGCADIEALSTLISSPSSSLKEIGIGDDNMSSETTERMLKTVLSPSSLEHVGLLGFQAVTLLEENRNLAHLSLYGSGDHLADIIPLIINLNSLSIILNPAGDGGLVKLLHALSHLKHLKTLNLSDNKKIGCADIEALSILISSPSSSLKELGIGDDHDDMSSETTEMMLKTVLSPTPLDHLLLINTTANTWTNQATKLLEENHNLTILHVRGSTDLCSSVARALCKNSHLKELYFASFSIRHTDDIVSSLVEMLRTNKTLETLTIRQTFNKDQLLTLNNALQDNHTLKTFEIRSLTFRVDRGSMDSRLTFSL